MLSLGQRVRIGGQRVETGDGNRRFARRRQIGHAHDHDIVVAQERGAGIRRGLAERCLIAVVGPQQVDQLGQDLLVAAAAVQDHRPGPDERGQRLLLRARIFEVRFDDRNVIGYLAEDDSEGL